MSEVSATLKSSINTYNFCNVLNYYKTHNNDKHFKDVIDTLLTTPFCQDIFIILCSFPDYMKHYYKAGVFTNNSSYYLPVIYEESITFRQKFNDDFYNFDNEKNGNVIDYLSNIHNVADKRVIQYLCLNIIVNDYIELKLTKNFTDDQVKYYCRQFNKSYLIFDRDFLPKILQSGNIKLIEHNLQHFISQNNTNGICSIFTDLYNFDNSCLSVLLTSKIIKPFVKHLLPSKWKISSDLLKDKSDFDVEVIKKLSTIENNITISYYLGLPIYTKIHSDKDIQTRFDILQDVGVKTFIDNYVINQKFRNLDKFSKLASLNNNDVIILNYDGNKIITRSEIFSLNKNNLGDIEKEIIKFYINMLVSKFSAFLPEMTTVEQSYQNLVNNN